MKTNILHNTECLAGLKMLPDNSIGAIITDPPYGLSFMGKKRDYDVPSVEIWGECLRVLKPGGHLMAFAGTRTQHRMAVRIEDAGFEIRDMIAWVYGSGFPKSLNIGKAVDKLLGNEREVTGKSNTVAQKKSAIFQSFNGADGANLSDIDGNLPLTKGNSEREGRGTALKPAIEPITLARKPLGEKTVAENVLKWGTGGLNIDESRVEHNEELKVGFMKTNREKGLNSTSYGGEKDNRTEDWSSTTGRFPANLIHDNSEEVRECFPNESERFFKSIIYQAKASKSERNMGCEELEAQDLVGQGLVGERNNPKHQNNHPTVKPIALMEYLINMITKKGSVVLDPFAGSGSTLIACKKLGRQYIGYEMDAEYCKIAEARIQSA